MEAYGPTWKLATEAQKQNRARDMYFGKGKIRRRKTYKRRSSYKKKYGRGAYWGQAIGAGIGSLFGNAQMGASIGDKGSDAAEWLYKALKKKHKGSGIYTGTGAYVQANDIAAGAGNAFQVPQFAPTTDGATIVVSHKEYIGDIYGPPHGVNFSSQVFHINPGIEKTFPYLSQLAANYDEYNMHQCIFTYRSTVADFASQSGQVGQIVAATQYNNANEPFSDKRSMMEYDASMSCKSSEHLISGVECDPTKLSGSPGKYTRVGPIKQGQDINQYDHAQFNIAVHDCPDTYANQVLGELWVSYTIELRKPKFFTAKGFGQQTAVFGSDLGTQRYPLRNYVKGESNNFDLKLESTIPLDAYLLANGLNLSDVKSLDHRADVSKVTQRADMPTTIVVFPGNYSGNVEITYVIRGDDAKPLYTGNDLNIDDIRLTGIGNISRISDIAQQSDQWNNAVACNSFLVSRSMKTITAHIRVEQATDGRDNVIFLYSDAGAPSDATNDHGVTAYLKFQEYNTIGNYKQDGSNDEVRMVDFTGTLVPFPSQKDTASS